MKTPLLPNEEILKENSLRHMMLYFWSGTPRSDGLGIYGHAYLTNKRLIFESHSFNNFKCCDFAPLHPILNDTLQDMERYQSKQISLQEIRNVHEDFPRIFYIPMSFRKGLRIPCENQSYLFCPLRKRERKEWMSLIKNTQHK